MVCVKIVWILCIDLICPVCENGTAFVCRWQCSCPKVAPCVNLHKTNIHEYKKTLLFTIWFIILLILDTPLVKEVPKRTQEHNWVKPGL